MRKERCWICLGGQPNQSSRPYTVDCWDVNRPGTIARQSSFIPFLSPLQELVRRRGDSRFQCVLALHTAQCTAHCMLETAFCPMYTVHCTLHCLLHAHSILWHSSSRHPNSRSWRFMGSPGEGLYRYGALQGLYTHCLPLH